VEPRPVINLVGLPDSTYSAAYGINNVGQVVGVSVVDGVDVATEWSHGRVIDLGGLPGTTISAAFAINDAGQAVGWSIGMGSSYATEWSDGRVIDLGGLPGSTDSYAYGINDAGQAVGDSRLSTVPEPSTWAMMLLGFAGLAFAGYRRSERVLRQNACLSIYQPDV
jgi:probable HAF family extracellular repeat protein